MMKQQSASGSFLFLAEIATLLGVAFCQGQTLTTLVAFNGANGAPALDAGGSLVQGADGNFYGTTDSGGSHNLGTVFKVTPSGVLTPLYNFGSSATDGKAPYAAMILASDGNFYGTTSQGGAADAGTFFQMTPSGAVTILYGFCHLDQCTDGTNPYGPLVQGSDGNFYGTTLSGGVATQGSEQISHGGTIFKITPTGALTTLYTFCSQSNCADGAFPGGGLTLASDGNFYGTTSGTPPGYATPYGTIYKFTPAGVLTTIYAFKNTGLTAPSCTLVQGADGSLYGTTFTGNAAASPGGVFKITLGGTYTLLHTFTGSGQTGGDGAQPPNYTALVQLPGGNLIGGTTDTVYEITPTGTMTTLHVFDIGTEGFAAVGMVLGKDGNIYGMTQSGGANGKGTIFKLGLQPLTFGNYTCTNTLPVVVTSVDSASAYGGYSYFGSGSWLEIKGTNLADPADPRLTAATNPGQWTSQDFNGSNAPTSLDGINVHINGKPAYVWYLSPGQLNVQAPEDSATGNVSIAVTNCRATGYSVTFARRAAAPGFLAPSSYAANGTQYMVAFFDSDNAYVLNASIGASFGLNSRPAKPGDQIYTYGIGFGDVTPSTLPGVIAQASTLVNPVAILFGTTAAAISYQGLTPGSVGLYQFNFTVPPSLANGDYQINVTQSGIAVPQTMFLTVHN